MVAFFHLEFIFCRQTLRDNLSIADNVLQMALLKIRSLCEEQCCSMQHEPPKMVFIDEKFGEKILTLDEFVDECYENADYVNTQLQALKSECLSITVNACQVLYINYFFSLSRPYVIMPCKFITH